jgi:hypothetical protein
MYLEKERISYFMKKYAQITLLIVTPIIPTHTLKVVGQTEDTEDYYKYL